MTEIPEHLLKRAQAARDKAAESDAAPPAASSPASGGEAASDSRIPAHLLERSKSAKQKAAGEAREAFRKAAQDPAGNVDQLRRLHQAVADRQFAAEVAAMLARDFLASRKVDAREYDHRPLLFKAGARAARLLAPIL